MNFLSYHWTAQPVTYAFPDLSATASDHVPLLLEVLPQATRRKRNFKFENYWTNLAEVEQIISQEWGSVPAHDNPVRNVHRTIKATQQALNLWSGNRFRGTNNYLQRSKWVLQLLDDMEEVRNLSLTEFSFRISLREHIFRLTKDKEVEWKQRTSIRWLKLGDKNTKYFHAVANTRRNKNTTVHLIHDGGNTMDKHEMEDAAYSHYVQLVGTKWSSYALFDLRDKVGPSFSADLLPFDEPILSREIKQVIMEMPSGKANGPNGLPIEFYKKYWHT